MTIQSIQLIGNLGNLHHDSVTKFIERLESLSDTKGITIYINSTGGDSNVATSIYLKIKSLKDEGWYITTIGDMHVKSGAFLIYLVGDKRLVYKDCKFMYHPHFKRTRLAGR